MKKITLKQRELDVRNGIKHRRIGHKRSVINKPKRVMSALDNWQYKNDWLNHAIDSGSISVKIHKRNLVTLYLPEVMNFSDDYEKTIINITCIRMLASNNRISKKAYRLAHVNFDALKMISTSAALVLTAELSKWDDTVRQQLKPVTDNWNSEILRQFIELGFFELFKKSKVEVSQASSGPLRLVKYIKGKCGDSEKPRELKEKIHELVGNSVSKWTFLHSGLTEAITNVSHHAYPKRSGFRNSEKHWYLTGSFNKHKNELKIVFYDQGIGIPKSLPASEVWEKVLSLLSAIPAIDRRKDETLLKAAVELDRTSTAESDRGKGLPDLLEFIKQRKDGYLSILSRKGLYKYSVVHGSPTVKSESFNNPVCGTLIIWCVTL